ncbi:F-box protein [Phanerochaete sordida]|uniref:F-box protein n=1 Tax=Phanerochaete sordida TaxID=48140 RepID=A0A9P3G5J8_9APHY|nr:F-box protein [Phanerochaete sordida]
MVEGTATVHRRRPDSDTVSVAEHFRINSLPNEILAMIFQELSDFGTTDLGGTWRYKSDPYIENLRWYYWTSVVLVCRKWAEAALGWPVLWSYIALDRYTPSALVDAFLQRSRQGPLRLAVIGPDGARKAKHILEVAGDRVRSIYLDDVYTEAFASLLPRWERGLPRLRRIHVDQSDVTFNALPFGHEHIEELVLDRLNWSLTPLEQCARLKVLTLQSPWAPDKRWDHRGIGRINYPLSTVSEIATLLRSLPLLTDLSLLLLWAPFAENASRLQASSVTLPHLRSLKLGYDARPGQALLDALSFPGSARVHLHFVQFYNKAASENIVYWTYDDFVALFAPIIDKISRNPAPFRALSLVPYEYRGQVPSSWYGSSCLPMARLCAWTIPRHGDEELLFQRMSDGFLEHAPPPAISIPIPYRADVLDAILWPKLDLSQVSHVWLGGLKKENEHAPSWEFTVDVARELLAHVPNVQRLAIAHSPVCAAARLLAPRELERLDDEHVVIGVALPLMRTVALSPQAEMTAFSVIDGKVCREWRWAEFLEALREREEYGWGRAICTRVRAVIHEDDAEQSLLFNDYFSIDINPGYSPDPTDWIVPEGRIKACEKHAVEDGSRVKDNDGDEVQNESDKGEDEDEDEDASEDEDEDAPDNASDIGTDAAVDKGHDDQDNTGDGEEAARDGLPADGADDL